MTWILILMMHTGDYRGSVALHSVPGFTTEASCMTARKMYTGTFDGEPRFMVAHAICVSQPK